MSGPTVYEAYEKVPVPAYNFPLHIVVEAERDGMPWPVSGDATTIRQNR